MGNRQQDKAYLSFKEPIKMNIKERLSILLKHKNMNLKEFSIFCGVPYKTLQNYTSGQRKTMNSDTLAKIATHTGISINWLLTGQGSMYNEESTESTRQNKKLQAMSELLHGLNESQQREICATIEEKKQLNKLTEELEALKTIIRNR